MIIAFLAISNSGVYVQIVRALLLQAVADVRILRTLLRIKAATVKNSLFLQKPI